MITSKLKPYNKALYTPFHNRPIGIGQIVILLDDLMLRGYCAVVTSISNGRFFVRLLDSTEGLLEFDESSLLQTAKTPEDFLRLYEPTALSFDAALDNERVMVDFSKIKKKGGGSGRKKKEIRELTDVQKRLVVQLIMERLKELKV